MLDRWPAMTDMCNEPMGTRRSLLESPLSVLACLAARRGGAAPVSEIGSARGKWGSIVGAYSWRSDD